MTDERDLPDFSEIFAYPKRESLAEGRMDAQELAGYRVALLPYYHRYMLTLMNSVDRNTTSNKLKEIGGLYRNARVHAGILRAELAGELEQAGCPANPVELAAHEGGLISTADLPEQFPTTFRQICISRLQRPTSRN